MSISNNVDIIGIGERLRGGINGNLNNAARTSNPIFAQIPTEAIGLIVRELARLFPFPAKVTGWQEISSGLNQWEYAWTEMAPVGDNTFTDKTFLKRSGTFATDKLLNVIEAVNDGTGVHGNSVDVDGLDYPDGFDQQPIGAGTGGTPDKEVIIIVFPVVGADGVIHHVTQYENADDGTCEAP